MMDGRRIVQPILITALMVATAMFCGTCSDDDDGSPTSSGTRYTVSGTLTFPASVTNRQWYAAVDSDHTGDNGMVNWDSGTVTGTSVDYSIDKIPAGDYYIYAEVDMTGNPGPWDSGDYIGMGCKLSDDNPCQVTIDSNKTVDIDMFVCP